MGVEPKIVVFSPKSSIFVHRGFPRDFHHPFWGSNFPPIFGKQHPNGSSGRETFSEALQSRHSLNDLMVSPLQASWVELWTPGGLEDGGDIASAAALHE